MLFLIQLHKGTASYYNGKYWIKLIICKHVLNVLNFLNTFYTLYHKTGLGENYYVNVRFEKGWTKI